MPRRSDGAELRRTLGDLLALGPSVESIAAVPFGMTRYRRGFTRWSRTMHRLAGEVIDILEEYGEKSLAATGRRVISER